ncbi:hypothetical protein [Saccharopolyspora phatthalungensis]|uniref:GGDEF domain-containing protein n=1 Tax=Saccharopolyspora phatthalungensis TaxID=664693 RepID=A0A840Q5H6_9PSEU|nr:hypothetical protein [Saccharopolyspora phatthalungensis]MBB5155130.1 hypothetical protein [Saccharopolyspora phatthalungensis]
MREWSLRCDATTAQAQRRALRSRWRTASLAAGWPFPSDWGADVVDAVCAAVIAGDDLAEPLAELGASRAEAGVGLAATLQDVAALHAVSAGEHDGLVFADPDAVPTAILRTTALGWAEVMARLSGGREVEDPLTGLTTASYLRTRLREVYRAARAEGRRAGDGHVLVTVSLGVTPDGYARMMAMVLIADALRTVFDGGETTSLLRSATAAVLAARDRLLPARCLKARWMIQHRLAADPALRGCQSVQLREELLPADHGEACDLLATL